MGLQKETQRVLFANTPSARNNRRNNNNNISQNNVRGRLSPVPVLIFSHFGQFLLAGPRREAHPARARRLPPLLLPCRCFLSSAPPPHRTHRDGQRCPRLSAAGRVGACGRMCQGLGCGLGGVLSGSGGVSVAVCQFGGITLASFCACLSVCLWFAL